MIEDMKVANIEYGYGFQNGGTEQDGPNTDWANTDWAKIQTVCCFSHTEACEFIVYLGSNEEFRAHRLEEHKKAGMSKEFLEECERAIEAGYNYACFYA